MTLIFDIETVTFGKPDPNKDKFRFMGAYEIETDTYHFIEDHDEVKNLFKKHKIIIGFNSKHYDEPILKRAGLMPYRHIHIDLREVIKKREMILGCKNEAKSLDNMAKFFDLQQSKSTLDYNLLKKESLSKSEYELIKEYTLQDIKVTTELFNKLCDFFKSFKKYLNKYDQSTYKWLTSSVSVYTYKVICNKLNIKEEYNDDVEHKGYMGGDVSEPIQKEEHENIYCFDFNSLYPHIMIQANLFSYKCNCCTDKEKWKGNELFPIIGRYCLKKHGNTEKIVIEIYDERTQLKKNNDPAQYALKLVINTLYGLTGNPVFKSLYKYESAHDCTLIGRESIKLARQMFKDAGYNVLYSDTDSIYLKDNYIDLSRLLLIKNSIIKKIKNNLPFPVATFDMSVDEEIKHIWFFKKNDRFLKKHYVYVNSKDELIIKGLPMIKNDSSKIGYNIFKKHMKEQIIQGKLNFSYNQIKDWLYELLKNNIDEVTRKFKVNSFESYKTENQLQAQIAKRYGEGIHLLLPNKYIGVGQSIRYCTIEEFDVKGLNLNALVLNKFWSEMEYFVNYIPTKFKMNNKNKNRNQISLNAWTNI